MKVYPLLVAALFAAPAYADPSPAPTAITMTGEPGYEMQCHLFPRGGDENVRFLDAGRSSIAADGLYKLSCDYKGSPRGPTTITITSSTLPCPFKVASGDACATTLRKSAVGSFEVKEKRN